MELEDAIKHAEEKSGSCECGKEHAQLAKWLKELAALRASPSSVPEDFNHSIGAERFTTVRGAYWWHVRAGDGTQNIGKFHTKLAAEDMAMKLLTAFRDGAFMQYQALLAAATAYPPESLTWLYTHCRDIGMNCKSDSGKWEHDIALWTINLTKQLAAAQKDATRFVALINEMLVVDIDGPIMRGLEAWEDKCEVDAALQTLDTVRNVIDDATKGK